MLVACRTDGRCAMARKQVSQLKAWSRVVVTPGEPMITTHGFAGVGPGFYAVVKSFQKRPFGSVLSSVKATLRGQLKNWQTRWGYNRQTGQFEGSILEAIVRQVLKDTLKPLRLPGNSPGRVPEYAIPFADIWSGKGDRVQRMIQVNPVVVIKLEENSAKHREPRPTSIHGLLPIKPSAVLCASELLSCSFGPAQHRLLMHAPRIDSLTPEENVAANIVLMSRVSAMADFAVTPETAVTHDMLRHGDNTRALREHVANQGGRCMFRHVHMARDDAAAPQAWHPSGNIDGDDDALPNLAA